MIYNTPCSHCKTPFPSINVEGVCQSCKDKIDYYNKCIVGRKAYPSPRKRQFSNAFVMHEIILKKNIDNPSIYDILLCEAGWKTLKDIINQFLIDNKLDNKALSKVNYQDCVRYDFLIGKAIKAKDLLLLKKDYSCFEREEEKLLDGEVDIAGTIFIDYKNYNTKYDLHLMITTIKQSN